MRLAQGDFTGRSWLGDKEDLVQVKTKHRITVGLASLLTGLAWLALAGHHAEPPASLALDKGQVEDRAAPQSVAKDIKAVPEKAAHSNLKAIYQRDVALPEAEEKIYFAEMQKVFLELAPSAVDPVVYQDQLIKLNERYRSGVRSSLETLEKSVETREDALRNLAILDYFRYRMRWDERLKADVLHLLGKELPEQRLVKSKAALIADRLELVEILAEEDWDLALQALGKINDPWLGQQASMRAFATRKRHGGDGPRTIEEIALVRPGFVPPS